MRKFVLISTDYLYNGKTCLELIADDRIEAIEHAKALYPDNEWVIVEEEVF